MDGQQQGPTVLTCTALAPWEESVSPGVPGGFEVGQLLLRSHKAGDPGQHQEHLSGLSVSAELGEGSGRNGNYFQTPLWIYFRSACSQTGDFNVEIGDGEEQVIR